MYILTTLKLSLHEYIMNHPAKLTLLLWFGSQWQLRLTISPDCCGIIRKHWYKIYCCVHMAYFFFKTICCHSIVIKTKKGNKPMKNSKHNSIILKSYYKSSSVCLFVCLFVPYLLRGPLTDLRQTWWVYAGGPRNCPWGVLFRKRQRVDGSTGHFRFPLYYIYASLTPHSCKRRLCCYCI